MVDADKKAFTSLIQALGAAFNREITTALLTGYWLGLKDLELAAFEASVARALQASRFMPAPAELRELSGEEPISARAVRVWETVVNAIRGVGSYASVDFEDPAVNATVRSLGGWQRLCLTESEELHKWVRKDFENAFEQYARYGVHGDAGRYLIGIHEQDARSKGYEISPPVRIALPKADREQPKLLEARG